MKLKYMQMINNLTFIFALTMYDLRELDTAFDKTYTEGYLNGYKEAIKKTGCLK